MLFVYMFMTELRHWCELLVEYKEASNESDEEEEMPDCVKHIYS